MGRPAFGEQMPVAIHGLHVSDDAQRKRATLIHVNNEMAPQSAGGFPSAIAAHATMLRDAIRGVPLRAVEMWVAMALRNAVTDRNSSAEGISQR